MLIVPLPTLKKAGMFDLFTTEEWISKSSSPGRKFVGEKAKEMGY
jgi:hypothetical protein